MMFCSFKSWVAATLFIISRVSAQETVVSTDPISGFKFPGAQSVYNLPTSNGAISLGLLFPPNRDKDDYIGYLTSARPSAKGAGWTGISHTSGMTKSLLLVVWPEGQNIMTSFRWAADYKPPILPYLGKGAILTQLAHNVNATHYTLTYRCQNCTNWDQMGMEGSQSMKEDNFLIGWAQGKKEPAAPKNPSSSVEYHDLGFGIMSFEAKSLAAANYDALAATVPKTPSIPQVPASTAPKGTAAPPAKSSSAPPSAQSSAVPSPAKGTTPKGAGKGPKGPPKGGPERRLKQ